MTDLSVKDGVNGWWAFSVDSVLHSYSIIYFSQRRWMGLLLLLCTLHSPAFGLIGLGGVVVSLCAALLIGFDRSLIRGGTYLFNSLLISLALGYLYACGQFGLATLLVSLGTLSVLTLLVTVGLTAQMSQTLGLPSISLPFVVSQLVLFLLLPRVSAPAFALHEGPAWTLLDLSFVELATGYFRSFGVILFLPHVALGVVVFLAVLLYSRLMVLYATVAMAVGIAALSFLPSGLSHEQASYIAFNFIYCGIGLGGVFFVPSRGTLLLVVLGAALCAGVSVAVVSLFNPLGFVPLALPMNLVILLVVYVMKMRATARAVQLSPYGMLSPEANFRRYHTDRARFPEFGYPTILCPFSGEWVVTQGFDGRFTHQREWRHALDFEVMDDFGRRYSGSPQRLDNFHTFNTPVLSPAIGTVFKTVDYIDDRPPGSNNFANPWGNLVILRLDAGQYVKLCHLRKRSICVKEGQRVKPGDAVGYCGNSGRSPVPHLHVQVQTTAQVGATTVPFRLRHYVERNGGESVYHVAGIPAEDARIQAAAIDSRIAKYFDNISRREYAYRLKYADHESHETVSCRVDHFGSYVFESSTGGRLTASMQDQVFHVFDHEGGPGVLYWLWLGLGRVPFIANPRTHWHDVVDLHPMLRAWAKLLLDINDPFFGYRSVEVTRSFEPPEHDGGEARPNICLATTFRHDTPSCFVAKDAIPRKIQTYVSESNWVARIVVDLDRPLTIQQV